MNDGKRDYYFRLMNVELEMEKN